ncbi:multi-sensor signal transduction histidine kinase [Leptolyngbya sp. Heron Island J]|uniref:ATP-binding protein n=1 Tax=Leptolyngbya sp. Heron Island J TaxID=1385935 RepID=UPI0003B9A790|nr:ATP-binding protein [Leptolyngbya sp. Heron Island J]ESA38774.1 multi-sensor signal transduction histidine kinase [Leptolyngbya sp. Heron Island J]
MGMQHLFIIEDDQGKRAVSLQADSGSIGRDASNSIVLHSKEVSRQHAILLRVIHPGQDDYGFRIIDGNLQGKPSTNGLFVNGRRCSSQNLHHGDEIVFGANVKVRYHTTVEDENMQWLLSGGEDAAKYMATLIAAPVDASPVPESDRIQDAAIIRLASFPELFSHPIIELSLTGELTYLNPAAVSQFPTINLAKLSHPILDGVIDTVKAHEKHNFIRNISVGDRIFEQTFHYIPQSDLIRCYLVDITDRKRAEAELQLLHDELEAQIKERTTQLLATTERLKQEQTALQASYATNRALLNAIPDPMFRISHSGQFVNFSEPKHHTLPFSPASCLHHNLADVLTPSVADAMQQRINQVLTTGGIEILEFQLTADDKILHFEARIVHSATQEAMVIIRDITKRKQVETEIRYTLERERELNEMKTRFVSMTSHEFRTPLTTILSSAELLEHYGNKWTPEKQHQYLYKIQTAATHMTELLNDVLLINKAEAGRIEFNPQPLVLNDFCQEIIEELQISTNRHTLVLRSQLSSTPHPIDRKLMRHILTNLLSNAINYSPNGGEVLVTLDTADKQLELRVQDHGIGIPEDARSTLFESFVRGPNVGTISGTGLGLAIIQKSVELHQGHITFESTVGSGTTFIVTLPILTSGNPTAFSGNLVKA